MAEENGTRRAQRGAGPLSHARGQRTSRGLRARRALLAVVVASAALASPAFGASTHPFVEEWSSGANCEAHDIATDAADNVYVMCAGRSPNNLFGSIRKFSPTGQPIPFTASKSYVEGNEINEDPTAELKAFGDHAYIAVDNSSARPGYIYVADNYTPKQDPPSGPTSVGSSRNVDIFAPSGEYVTSIPYSFATGSVGGVGVDDEGYVYVLWQGGANTGSHISKYDPSNYREIEQILPGNGPCCIKVRPDSNGAVWVGWGSDYFDEGGLYGSKFGKYEADQWSTDLRPGRRNPDAIFAVESPFLFAGFPGETCPEGSEAACQLPGENFNVDLSTNDVYAASETYLPGNVPSFEPTIVPYSEGNAVDPVHQNGPAFGKGILHNPRAVAIDNQGNVWTTSDPNKVVKFARGATLPAIVTKEAAIADIGHYSAVIHASVNPEGGGPITKCQVAYGPFQKEKTYNGAGSPVTCDQATPYPDGSVKEVTAEITGLTPGHRYRFRAEAGNAAGDATWAPIACSKRRPSSTWKRSRRRKSAATKRHSTAS